MSTNPSHILIARNSRGPNNPSAALSSPTETHAAASGIFRSSTSAGASGTSSGIGHTNGGGSGSRSASGGLESVMSWFPEIDTMDNDDPRLAYMFDDPCAMIELDPTFTRQCRFPGTVKIVVQATTFWAHREILVFASPFFEAALSGDWSETQTRKLAAPDTSGHQWKRQSISSVITIPQLPAHAGDKDKERAITATVHDGATEMTFAPIDPDSSPEDLDLDDLKVELEALKEGEVMEQAEKEERRSESLQKLQGTKRAKSGSVSSTSNPKKAEPVPDAMIVLKEERACIFQDFLKFVYPHLECSITWNNVEGLMNISTKLCVPELTKQCLKFLLTHAAGKPIKAMRIAELFEEEQLYSEASRFVLDNPGGWNEAELNTLSQDTKLKLAQRRNWFLERVLKLGVLNIAKDYLCCDTCPDPTTCARLLDDKWKQAYQACFRFGPCQPSMVYRYLRGLEGVTPPLALTHLNCQSHAKSFVTALFDRMFSIGVRGSGSGPDPIPLIGTKVTIIQSPPPGPRRHFLYCSLTS